MLYQARGIHLRMHLILKKTIRMILALMQRPETGEARQNGADRGGRPLFRRYAEDTALYCSQKESRIFG